MKPSDNHNLEKKVKEAISVREKRKEIDGESNELCKKQKELEHIIKCLLKQGSKLSEDSEYYVKLKYKSRDGRTTPLKRFILELPTKYSGAKKYLVGKMSNWLDKKILNVHYGKKEEK